MWFILVLQNEKIIANTIPFTTMEQHTLKDGNNCLNTNIYSYLETSGSHSSNLYLSVVHFFSTIFNKASVAA
jgi:hypothetical protein